MSRLPKRVVVFGGTGFLGRAVVACLVATGIETRLASRSPVSVTIGSQPGYGLIEPVKADIRNAPSVAKAIEGCDGVVNAVGLYVESGAATFEAIHEQGARNVARQAAAIGVGRLVHVSGIGVDPTSPSPYVRARANGEALVMQACPAATILRPSALFGPDDSFIASLTDLIDRSPVLPLFGRGRTRLQPVHVGDVAMAVAQALMQPATGGRIYELGGPDVYSYSALLTLLCDHMNRRRLLVPVPFALWRLIAAIGAVLPNPPITEAQITLMGADNVVGRNMPSFGDLAIEPLGLTAHLLARDR